MVLSYGQFNAPKRLRHGGRNQQPEYQAGVQLMTWAWHLERQYPILGMLFHVPNGQHLRIEAAMRLKRSGVKPGVVDYMLPAPRGAYHGLGLELKADKGRVSTEQEWWIDALNNCGWIAKACWGFDEAREFLEAYCQLPEFDGQTKIKGGSENEKEK